MANTWDYSNQTKGCTLDARSYDYIDNIIGSGYNDIIRGNAKSNVLNGGAGSDQIWGGSGNESDTMQDSSGANMFWWGNGEGNDLIENQGKGSALYLYNFGFAERSCYFSGNDFIWSKKGGANTVNISGWLAQDAKTRIQSFVCNEGGVSKAYAWNAGAEIEVNLYDAYSNSRTNYLKCVDSSNAVLRGSTGSDTIYGGAGNDKIWGGAGGSDYLSGGAGADRYWWDAGDGYDTIEGDASDAITFWKSNKGSIYSRLNGNDLTVYSATDSLTIKNWSSAKIDSVTYADGSTGTLTETVAAAPAHRFNIEVDYSLDTTGFYTDYLKSQIETACRWWEDRIATDLPTTKAGTSYTLWEDAYTDSARYVKKTLTKDVDDLLVYARTYTSDQYWAYTSAGTTLSQFYFVAEVCFNTRPEGQSWDNDGVSAPNENNRFVHTFAHELGHALGINSGLASYADDIKTINGASYLTGPNAVAAYGGYVPLRDLSHPDFGVNSVMASSRTHDVPTNIDFAILKDVGFNIL